ncbi:hypothetical protein BDY21DRAFT_329529 [Lineolata rhizophorae]|uniref:Uncharacterized protein n=1 Tax=Lineolata rhizophorae TaxID=578093 RepID=A0A6A6PD12_9PEZI|nr:hypothetical protein BDY21DRAFT_329529 [Lineolata rhizophorae]
MGNKTRRGTDKAALGKGRSEEPAKKSVPVPANKRKDSSASNALKTAKSVNDTRHGPELVLIQVASEPVENPRIHDLFTVPAKLIRRFTKHDVHAAPGNKTSMENWTLSREKAAGTPAPRAIWEVVQWMTENKSAQFPADLELPRDFPLDRLVKVLGACYLLELKGVFVPRALRRRILDHIDTTPMTAAEFKVVCESLPLSDGVVKHAVHKCAEFAVTKEMPTEDVKGIAGYLGELETTEPEFAAWADGVAQKQRAWVEGKNRAAEKEERRKLNAAQKQKRLRAQEETRKGFEHGLALAKDGRRILNDKEVDALMSKHA